MYRKRGLTWVFPLPMPGSGLNCPSTSMHGSSSVGGNGSGQLLLDVLAKSGRWGTPVRLAAIRTTTHSAKARVLQLQMSLAVLRRVARKAADRAVLVEGESLTERNGSPDAPSVRGRPEERFTHASP